MTPGHVHPSSESLPELAFFVEAAQAVRYAASPTVTFRLAVTSDRPVRSLALNTQIRIVPTRRPYSGGDQERLVELFGTPERWGDTLRGFLWTNTTTMVPAFGESACVDLNVACTYDLEVAAAKYFYALRDGDIPLEFLFSGTVFYLGDGGLLRTVQVPWECEADFRLPVAVWKRAIENNFPGSAWLRLREDVFERLVAYKARHAFPTWEATIEELLGQ